MILVTGAAGKTGQAIIQALAERDVAVRAFVYRDKYDSLVKELGAKEIVVGDIRDEASFRQATDGVRAIYHICPNMNPAEVAIGRTAIAAAQISGIQHFVYHSVLHPQIEAMPHHWNKMRVEEMLFESGLDFTILQPAAYMQNILAGWTAIVEQGIYRVPYPVETRLGMVDLADVAAAVAIVLTESGHVGATYELAGSESLSQIEVASVLSEVLDRPVQAEQIPLADWTQQAKTAGLGTYQIETLIKMFRYYEQYDFWGNPRMLGWLLNRPPKRFQEFVKDFVSKM